VRGPLTEPQRDDLGRVRRAQQHLLALINDVLDFARIESGRVEFRMASMSLAEELATVHALIAPQAAARALELVLDVPADTPPVIADADRVRQILLNLMSNAVKFTPPGGTVSVRIRRDRDTALVQVEDTGIGIERNQLEAIFEPFVQVDGTLTRTREGTGLGLAISRELARGMGGDLTVRSRPGEGSTFTLVVPVERAQLP
jgi:signal transduction histidine kinase